MRADVKQIGPRCPGQDQAHEPSARSACPAGQRTAVAARGEEGFRDFVCNHHLSKQVTGGNQSPERLSVPSAMPGAETRMAGHYALNRDSQGKECIATRASLGLMPAWGKAFMDIE